MPSHAPNVAPGWIFPEGAMFDIEWDDIILHIRKRMLKILHAFVCAHESTKMTTSKKITSKKATPKRLPKATNKIPDVRRNKLKE
jgi:hypothetical protein